MVPRTRDVCTYIQLHLGFAAWFLLNVVGRLIIEVGAVRPRSMTQLIRRLAIRLVITQV